MRSVKKYITAYKLMWKQATDYRFDFVMEMVATMIPIIALLFLWNEIYRGMDIIQGYTFQEMLSYIILARFVTLIITPDFLFDIMGEIQDGEIQHYICKPISYVKYWFAKTIGRKSRSLVWSSFSVLVIFLIFKNALSLSITIGNISVFILTLFLSFVLYFQIIMVVSLLSFWFYEITSWYYTLTFAIEFLAGGLFPLTLLPEKVQVIYKYMPFKYLIYYPIEILVNGYNSKELLVSCGILISWILIFAVVLKKVWIEGIKYYELIGG